MCDSDILTYSVTKVSLSIKIMPERFEVAFLYFGVQCWFAGLAVTYLGLEAA